MPGPSFPELTVAFCDTLRSIERIAGGLTPEEWACPTGCPGWSVHDCVAHVVGVESGFMGGPEPPALETWPPYVRSDFAAHIERAVAARRDVPDSELLEEYHEVIGRRVAEIDALTDAQADEAVGGPMEVATPWRKFLRVRVLDVWMHEHDIRRALRRPCDADGPAARVAAAQIAYGLPRALPTRIAIAGAVSISVTDREMPLIHVGDGTEVVRLSMPFETLVALASGRSDADRETVQVDGEPAAAATVMDAMSLTP